MREKDNRPVKKELAVHSSAAEYLTYVAAGGKAAESFEIRYEDENIWLTQKMMAALYDVDVRTINDHIQKILNDGELILFYFLWYGLGRSWIEGLRTDSLYLGSTGIRVSQLLSVLLVLASGTILTLKYKSLRETKP